MRHVEKIQRDPVRALEQHLQMARPLPKLGYELWCQVLPGTSCIVQAKQGPAEDQNCTSEPSVAVPQHWADHHISITCFRRGDEVFFDEKMQSLDRFPAGTGQTHSEQLEQMPNIPLDTGFATAHIDPCATC